MKIIFEKKALKELKKIDLKNRGNIIEKIKILEFYPNINGEGNDSSGREVVDPIRESILEGERILEIYRQYLRNNGDELRKFFRDSNFSGDSRGYRQPKQDEIGQCIQKIPDIIKKLASHTYIASYDCIDNVALSFVLWFWLKNGGSIKTLVNEGNTLSKYATNHSDSYIFNVYREWFYKWFKEIFLKLTLSELIDYYHHLDIRGNIDEQDINQALFFMIFKGKWKDVIDRILSLEGEKSIVNVYGFVGQIIDLIDLLNMGESLRFCANYRLLGDVHVSELANLGPEIINIPTVDNQNEFIGYCELSNDIIKGIAKNRLEVLKKVIMKIYVSLDNDSRGERIRESIKNRLAAIFPELFADTF